MGEDGRVGEETRGLTDRKLSGRATEDGVGSGGRRLLEFREDEDREERTLPPPQSPSFRRDGSDFASSSFIVSCRILFGSKKPWNITHRTITKQSSSPLRPIFSPPNAPPKKKKKSHEEEQIIGIKRIKGMIKETIVAGRRWLDGEEYRWTGMDHEI